MYIYTYICIHFLRFCFTYSGLFLQVSFHIFRSHLKCFMHTFRSSPVVFVLPHVAVHPLTRSNRLNLIMCCQCVCLSVCMCVCVCEYTVIDQIWSTTVIVCVSVYNSVYMFESVHSNHHFCCVLNWSDWMLYVSICLSVCLCMCVCWYKENRPIWSTIIRVCLFVYTCVWFFRLVHSHQPDLQISWIAVRVCLFVRVCGGGVTQ